MKTITLTDDQFDTLFGFVNQKVESIIDTSVQYQDSEILNEWEESNKFCTWGDGDSLDRERVRDILLEEYNYKFVGE